MMFLMVPLYFYWLFYGCWALLFCAIEMKCMCSILELLELLRVSKRQKAYCENQKARRNVKPTYQFPDRPIYKTNVTIFFPFYSIFQPFKADY